ncbi:MAG: serine/threonine protein kinase [Phycisphaerales bacterium]|nr:serine/threonine protein kinase [Phycisphaerales bacterium]
MSDPRTIAGFTVLARIGEGARSELFAVHDPKSRQVWALKHVQKKDDKDQRFIEQCEREYAIGSKLDHPTLRGMQKLIKHRKMFKVEGVSLLMEFVDADSLDKRLPRTYADAARVFLHVGEALEHMHGKGFVHADLKPTNILITDAGDVKVIDLGQACPVGTVKKRIQGTPGYMAPEQARRESIDERTDIFNFGATMYWVLVRDVIPTMMPPSQGDDSLLQKVDADEVPPAQPPHEVNPRIPESLSKLVIDCVAFEAADRPASMAAVMDRLRLAAAETAAQRAQS